MKKNNVTVRPNILLIVSEDNGPHFGCYGDHNVPTPNVDRLASEGILFRNAYTTQAVCSPGRASILTGLYPHQNGQIGLATHKYAMYRHFPNLPGLLKSTGYRTGIIGKLHVNPESAFPWDYWWNDRAYISFAHRDIREMAKRADSFIGAGETPFLLMVNYPDAHLPLLRQYAGKPEHPLTGKDVVSLPFIGIDTPRLREHVADYYNCISRLDSAIGLLLERLAACGRADNTLVIYATDHGAQFPRGKASIYEGGLRVPLIMRWPGVLPRDSAKDTLVSHIDILPTILKAVEMDAESWPILPGHSLLETAKGSMTNEREFLFAEWTSATATTYFPQRSVRDHRYKLIRTFVEDRISPSAWGYLDNQQWETGVLRSEVEEAGKDIQAVYTTYEHPPEIELYDLKEDPWEFHNLAEVRAMQPQRERLSHALTRWQEESDDAILDPKILNLMTAENDQVANEFYPHDIGGGSRAFEWKYGNYLEPGKRFASES